MTFTYVVQNAAGITAIVGAIALIVTVIRAVLEYSKQNHLARFEKYAELSKDWYGDKDIQEIIVLLGDDPNGRLAKIHISKKEAFVGYYEEIALMLESGILKKQIAYYMFGYHTILCYENGNFWTKEMDLNDRYWTLFRRFAKLMKKIDGDVLAGKEKIDKWKFRF
jgi:AAA15 family ATPase/GTPase